MVRNPSAVIYVVVPTGEIPLELPVHRYRAERWSCAILRLCHRKGYELKCACAGTGTSRPDFSLRQAGQRPILARRIVEAHAPACKWRRPEDGQETKVGGGIFSADRDESPDSDPSEESGNESDGRRHHTFASFTTHVMADAQRMAYLAVNPLGRNDDLVQYTANDLFTAIDQRLHQLDFGEQRSAYDCANAAGRTLRFGLITETIPPPSSENSLISVRWWVTGGQARQVTVIAAPALAAARRALRMIHGELPPPYLSFAVVDQHGLISKARFFPVFGDGLHVVPAASGYERSYVWQAIQPRACVLKFLTRGDGPRLARILGLDSPAIWRCVPDYGSLRRTSDKLAAAIVEVFGFTKDSNPVYHADRQRKSTYFQNFPLSWSFESVDGWTLPELAEGLGLTWPQWQELGPIQWTAAVSRLGQKMKADNPLPDSDSEEIH